MLGWPLLLIAFSASLLLRGARLHGARFWAGIALVFVFGLFGGAGLVTALVVNVAVNPPF